MKTLFFKKSIFVVTLFILIGSFHISYSQEYRSFTRSYDGTPTGPTYRYQNNIKGDLIFIANNIVNRDGGTNSTEPEDPYNNLNNSGSNTTANRNTETGGYWNYNDYKDMRYIDVDNDASTFSSSSATLTFPDANCNLIRYAALYWSATYPSAEGGQNVGTNRQNDFNSVKLKVPGGTYVDITADEILYDGFTAADNQNRANSPYACYANVTNLITPLADPSGEYTIANIRAVQGQISGGASGGWTLVIVYENPTLSGKLITTFDGFARVNSANPNVNINYSGFTTIPSGPVRANIGAAALEGDYRITGDQLRIRERNSDPYTTISNGANPQDNFFNSNISTNGVVDMNRNPNSLNTLGYDTDVFRLPNGGNSVIRNNATQATFRFTSNGDQYYPFFNSFNIEIIEPNIVLEKKVFNLAETVDLTGSGVNLGDNLKYILSFQNTGNDDATNFTIRDVLPVNVTLDEAALNAPGNLPPGVTYVFDASTRTIVFTIPPGLVVEGAPVESIRMQVKVAENCFDFVNACSNQIQNLAYATYQGVENDNVITDDPSVTDFDACGFVTPGATNFLLDDLSDCDFLRTVELCGSNVLLDAGDNFDDYIWYRDVNENGLIDLGTDIVINDGNPDGDLSTQNVTQAGTYIVDKIVADPCKGFQEIISVVLFGSTQTNPITDFFNARNSDADPLNDIQGEILRCSIDGEFSTNIFLCGSNDTELIQVNIPDALSLEWQQLDESTCTATDPSCPNKGNSCYTTIATGNAFNLTDSGKYRLVINYQNGCSSRFYFSAFKNNLDVNTINTDIFCNTNGNITVTNLGSGYGFQLYNLDTNTAQVPFSANNGPSFDIATAGNYRVDVRQLDNSGNPIPNSCLFESAEIGIRDRDFTVNLTTVAANCYSLGSINIQTLNVRATYNYDLRLNDGTIHPYGTGTRVSLASAETTNNYTFSNLNPGDYTVIVTTQDGCTDTQNITVTEIEDLRLTAVVTADIGCSAGIITLTPAGGFPDPEYNYAIWSINGTDLYASIGAIPGTAYSTDPLFRFGYRDTDFDGIDEYFPGEAGTYEFVVVDGNNCFIESNIVTIADRGNMTIAINDDSPITCSGNNDASITINTTNGIAPFEYTIDGAGVVIIQDTPSFVGLAAGTYDILVTDSSGCSATETHTISQTNAITAEAVQTKAYTCLPGGEAEITVGSVTATAGGSGNYQYSINGGAWTASTTGGTVFTNLTDGTYSIRVRDALSTTCFITLPNVVIAPLPTAPTLTSAVAYNCDGSGNITVSPFNASYIYTLGTTVQTGAAANVFNNIPTGNHTITVDYGSSCTTSLIVNVESGRAFTASLTSSTNVSCNGLTDGTITFEVLNFNPTTGFEYSIDGGAYTTSLLSPVTTPAVLGAGSSTITVRRVDDNTCTQTITRTITQPTAVNATASISSPYTCSTTGATLTANATGGTPTYVYQLENTSGTVIGTYDFATNGANRIFTNVTAGNYIVRARDARGCEDIINSPITIVAPSALNFTAVPTLCYSGANDGTITVNVTGGNGGLLFSINNGPFVAPSPTTASIYTFTNLASGTYVINVRDQLGCSTTPQNITINPELSVSANASAITTCATSTDVTITATGGDANYVYAIVADGVTPVNSDFSTTNPIAISAAGNYDVYVRDHAGAAGFCSDMFDIIITKNDPIAIVPTVTDVTCFGSNNGAISLAVTGGNAPYSYSINNGTTYQTTVNFPNLTAGVYSVLVRDADLCTQPLSVVINEPNAITAEAVQTAAYTCLPGGEAEITVGSVTATAGGSGNYQYSINGGAWTASTTGGTVFTNLTEGTYAIRVRDALATTCFITLPNVVITPLPTAPTLTSAVAYNCDGSGNITVSPFNASYIYTLGATVQTGAAANVFNNIPAGNHTITVDYGSSCTTDIVVNVQSGRAFTASITSPINVSCFGDSNGGFTINASNFGAGGFEYRIGGTGAFSGPFTTSQTVTGLTAQAYAIEVRDVNSPSTCTIPLTQTITQPNAVTVTASITTQFTCANTGATITAVANGGTPTYTYQLETNTGTVVRAYQTNAAFTNVPANAPTENYIVRVLDSRSCTNAILPAITVNTPQVPTFTAIPTACYSGNNDGTIQVDITSLPGNGNFQYRINSGTWITPGATTYTFTGLANGSYTIDVRDGYGCNAVQETVVLSPQLVVTTDIVHVSSCADGSITVNATGGNGVLVYAIVPANSDPTGLFTTTNSLIITNAMATANPAGYDVYVRDNNGVSHLCSYLEEDIIINTATTLTISGTPTDPECYDGLGSINAVAGGGATPYIYTLTDLSPADGIDYSVSYSNITSTNNLFDGIGVGDYEITLTDTAGCSITSSVITINNAVEITADIIPILPSDCVGSALTDYGFEFDNLITPTPITLIEYSYDNGSTWNTDGVEQRGIASGTTVYPSIRVTLVSGAVCQKDFPRYIIPYPLDNLDISISAIVVDCNDLQVTVQGTAGSAPYEYAYSEDPSTFNPSTATWLPGGTVNNVPATVPAGHGNYTWLGLTPGRTYVFYVRDATGCVRQSLENVNDLVAPLPIDITSTVSPTCFGASTGEITYTLNPSSPNTHMRWEFFELGNPTPIEVSGGGAVAANILYNNTITLSGLPQGEYYIEVQQSDGTTDSCRGGSENVLVDELRALSATATPTRNISCNLPGLIAVTGITGGGGAPYTFDVTGPVGFTALTGLTSNPIQIPVNSPAGNYTVTINDQYGCPVTLAPVSLTLSPNPTIDSVTQNNCSAPISLQVVGSSIAGNIRYAIVTSGATAPTSFLNNGGLFNGIAPGSYDVYIIDGNGCTAVQTAFIINPVLAAQAELTKLLDCTGTPDAAITIEALTGSGNYEYSISGAATVAQTTLTSPFVYNTSVAGDYTITVYDTATPNSVLCNRTFVVNVPARVEPVINTITATDITCIGDNNGTISITAIDNATGPYTFEITSLDGTPISISPTSTTNTTAEFTGLAPTTTAAGYIVTITGDALTNNCSTDSSSILITEPAAVTVTINPLVDIVQFECTTGTNTDNNATITVNTVSGGSGTYVRYVFENTGTSTIVQDGTNNAYIETNRLGGTYSISVYDDKGCIGTTTATINAFDELLTPTITIDEAISCTNAGEDVTINAFGSLTDSTTPAGLANYEFRLLPGAFGPSNVFTDLAIGNHTFEVRNINTQCVVTISHTVTNPNTFTVATPVTTDVICVGTATGTATFAVTDPTYAGTYSWEIFNSDTTPTGITGTSAGLTATGLIAGDYYVTFTQDGIPTCENRAPFSIAEPTDVLAAGIPTFSPITCVPGTDGVIEITNVTGGWGGYAYYVSQIANPDPNDVSNYVSNPRFENLGAGTYEIWVIDSRGCPLQLTDITLNLPTAITADLQLNNENCSNFEGELQVINQAGGQGSNYSYQLQQWNGTAYVNLRAIQTTDTFSNLGAGQYQVIVSDQWGCAAPTANSITLYEEMVPLATVVKAIDCTVDPGGQITISQTGGNGPFNYTGTYPDGSALTPNTDGIFSGLTQDGEYIFTITDAACAVTIRQTLAPAVQPATPTIDAFTNVTCFNAADGTIAVSLNTNGFDPYTFQITDMDGTAVTINPTSSTATSAEFTGLANTVGAGYTITIIGSNNCSTTITQAITQPTAVLAVATPTPTQFNCTVGNTTNYATIDLTGLVTGGSGNYVRYVFVNTDTSTTVQDGSNPEYTETNLIGGNYTITVYDDMGCSDVTTASIAPFIGIGAPTVTINNNVTCNGNDEAILVGITITPATATPNLTYTVTSTNGYNQTIASTSNSELFSGLGIGNYTITITNTDTGCSVSTTHSIRDPKVIDVTSVKVTDETCLNDGVDGGSFNVSIANYTGGYDYQVFLANGTPYSAVLSGNTSTPLVISNLPIGSYYVTITETDATSTFCSDNSNAVTIIAPEFPITAVVSEQSNVTCDNNRGSILVDPSGGMGPYTITIDSGTQTFTQTGVQAYIFTGLSAGTFAITITDALGCVNNTYSQTLVQPAPIVADISADIVLTCYGDDTGFVTATLISGGIGAIKYQLNTYDATGTVVITTSVAQNSNTFTGLFSGLYSITVSDNVRCYGETPIATISDPIDVFGSLTMTQSITCANDLELLLNANGGTAPYSYSTDGVTFIPFNNGNEHVFNALPSGNAGAGTYRYYVQDSFNCTSILSNEIKATAVAPIVINVDTTAATVNCNGDNSAIVIARASGGLGNYFYELLDTATSITPFQGPNTNGIFRDLTAGNYYIRVTSEDCVETTEVITIIEPAPLIYTDDYSAVICAGDTNGYINVLLTGGSGDYKYAISPNLAQFDDVHEFTNLRPGTYTVIAQDQNGCFVQTDYTIAAATPIIIDATPTGETCLGSNDGSIELILSGGTAPYSTRLENTSYVPGLLTYADLPSGTHTVYVQDALGCETSVEVTIAAGVNLKATVAPMYECTGDTPNNYLVVTHEDTSVEGVALYQLDDENSADVRLEPSFTNIAPGDHTLIISLNGCVEIIPFTIENFDPLVLTLENNNINEITAVATGGDGNYTFYFDDKNNGDDNTMFINRSGVYTVRVVDGNGCEAMASISMEFIDIEIPNFFTPNNDNENDVWKPRNLEGFPNILMIIFDRYGREVYRMGADDPGWDGFYHNSELPTGDYWYVIKLKGENDDREFVGHFTLYR